MELTEFKDVVFAAGRQAGLEDMEIYASRAKSFRVRFFQKEIDDYVVSVEQGVGFRAQYAGKVGYAYVETLDEDSVNLLVEGAKANAQIIDSTDTIEFFAGSESYPEVAAYSEELEAVPPEERISFAEALETEALASDER